MLIRTTLLTQYLVRVMHAFSHEACIVREGVFYMLGAENLLRSEKEIEQ